MTIATGTNEELAGHEETNPLIAKYTASVSGVVPTFNSGYQYTVNETESNGIYTVEITSYTDFTSCSFKNKSKLLTVEYLKVTDKVTNMSDMFSSCYRLTQLDTSNWDTSQVTNMDSIFASCSDLTQLDVSNWDTSNVTNMRYTFYYCESLTQLDVSKWNTNKITDMRNLFGGCYQLTTIGNVSNWDTSSVTNMDGMFSYCYQLAQLDVSNFDTSKVTNMSSMFYYCSQLTQLDVSNFDTKNVTTMRSMFSNCSSLTQLDLSNFDTSSVTDMDYMFSNCSQLIQLDVSNFDTSNATRTSNMFASCSSLNEIIATNVSTSTLSKLIAKIPTKTSDSYGTIKAKNITNEITSSANAKYWNVTDKMLIARYTANISGVVPTFNSGYQYTVNETESDGVYTVELYSGTDFTICSFKNKYNLLTVEYLKVTDKVTDMSYMFRYCNSLTSIGDISKWNTSNVTNMSHMFEYCSELTQLDLSNWNTSNVTDMNNMFYYCIKLTQLGVSNWDTGKVTDMTNMFYNCSKLTQLDVSNWDTSNVTNMKGMFQYCSKLTQLDLSNWNTSKVTSMTSTFYNCSKLTQLDISNWDTSKVTDMKDMFYYCSLLNNIIATNVSTSTLSTLVTALPTKTSDSYGTIKVTNTTDEITSSAKAKYWNISVPMIMARYTTNASGVIPVFNEGYQYTVNETESNGIYTVELYSYNDCTSISFADKKELLEVYYVNTSKLTSAYNLFYNCANLTYVDLRNSDFSNIETIERMFTSCVNLLAIDGLNDLDVSKVTNFGAMFRRCSKLTNIDVSKWDTSSGIIMSGIFTDCSNLIEINIANWDMSHANSVSQMFYGCSALMKLKMTVNLNQEAVTTYWFNKCNSLIDVQIFNFDTYTINKVIDELPTRSVNNQGSLIIPKIDNSINTATADSKYWIVSPDPTNIRQIHLGDTTVSNLYIGEVGVKKVYLGEVLVYENKQTVDNVDTLYNEFTSTLFILKENALTYDEEELTLNINNNIIRVECDEENSNLNIGGDK